MANYIKSEFYRILHDKTIYVFTLVMTALTVFLNLVLYLFQTFTPEFRYGNTNYTFSLLIGSMQLFYIGAFLVAAFLSSDEYKSGVLKNVVAGGIGRIQILLGKCIVYGITATASAAVILMGFIGSAQMLLGWNPAVPVDAVHPLRVLLLGTAANLPFSLACVVLAVSLYQLLRIESQVYVIWISTICLIPIAINLLGLRIPLCAQIAGWMPWNFLKTGLDVSFNSPHMDALWMHPQGFWKCIVAGVIGIVLFGAVGVIGFRNKDI